MRYEARDMRDVQTCAAHADAEGEPGRHVLHHTFRNDVEGFCCVTLLEQLTKPLRL